MDKKLPSKTKRQNQPSNDKFASPALLGEIHLVEGSNIGATAEPNEPRHRGSNAEHSVWYRWQAPITGVAFFTTIGSSFKSRVAAYLEARSGNDFSILDPIEEVMQIPRLELLLFKTMANKTYRIAVDGRDSAIAVDGRDGASGDFLLEWASADKVENLVISRIIISGHVRRTNGNGVRDVQMTALGSGGGPPIVEPTDSDGNYAMVLPGSLQHLVTPMHVGFHFDPHERRYPPPRLAIDTEHYTAFPSVE